MPSLTDIDKQFRTLHHEKAAAYDENVRRLREQRDRLPQIRQVHAREREQEILRVLKLDQQQLDQRAKDDEAAVQQYIREIRPTLVNRPTRTAYDAKKLALSSGLLGPQNMRSVTVYATSVLAADHAELEGIPGEKGNPWVLPSDPGQIKVAQEWWGGGSGWCWVARPVTHFPNSVDCWFCFQPDQFAVYYLLAFVTLHGFYMVQSNNDWWNCKYASVSVRADMDVYQYFWQGNKRFDLLAASGGSIDQNEAYDEYGQFDYQAFLKPGDPVWVWVGITLWADAYGAGSYANINFNDGAANYIEPLLVAVGPIR